MVLLACGVNHKTAPIELREKLAFDANNISEPLQQLYAMDSVEEAAILSTCNRTEIYLNTNNPEAPLEWLSRYHKITDLREYTYQHNDYAAVKHMLRVASGLDSMILGEPQIFGQMKSAYQTAQSAGTIGTKLSKLFQHVFSVTKQVRTQTNIGKHPVSIVFASINLAKRIFSNLKNCNVLLIGAGETIELAAEHLYAQGVRQVIAANRTKEKAKDIVARFNGKAITISEIPEHLAQCDIVFTATASQLPILGKGLLERVQKQRKHRHMLIIDLAVPRDVEPEVAQLNEIYLYNIDAMQGMIQDNLKEREVAARHAESIINIQSNHFVEAMNLLDHVDLVTKLRSKHENVAELELKNALSQIESGASPELVLAKLTNSLTNKFLHKPTTAMRDACAEYDKDTIAILKKIFKI